MGRIDTSEKDRLYYKPDDRWSQKYRWFVIDGTEKSPICYEIKEDDLYLYPEGKALTCSYYVLESQHFKEIETFCTQHNIPFKKEIPDTSGKLTIGKLLKNLCVKSISIRYGHTRTILKDKNREIISYVITPYSGIIIMRKKTPKGTFLAYKYTIPSLSYRYVSMENLRIEDALREIKKFKTESISVSLTPKLENEIQTAIFMEKL